jgi:sulfate transporter 3
MQITRPKMMVQGNIKGTDIYRDLHHYKEAQRVSGFLILAIEAPINFANSNYLNERSVISLYVLAFHLHDKHGEQVDRYIYLSFPFAGLKDG